MSEYWVSQAKYYCKYCNAWMADNKPSRTNHEFSVKHKANVDLFNKKKREANLFGSRSEDEVKKQLDMIDKLARDAIQEDRRDFSELFQSSSSSTSMSGAITAIGVGDKYDNFSSRESDTGAVSSSSAASFEEGVRKRGMDKEIDPFDPVAERGLHSVRGQYYLEGKKSEEFLKTGITCQLLVDSKNAWFDAVVINRRRSAHAPNTLLESIVLDVQYVITSEDEGEEGETDAEPQIVTEEGVSSDRIRIYSNEFGEVLHIDGSYVEDEITKKVEGIIEEDMTEKVYSAPVNENTGFSSWTTVSVQMIDEKEVIRKQKALEKQVRKQSEMNKTIILNKEEAIQTMLSSGEPSDVLSEFNPNGSNSYRGVAVGEDFMYSGDIRIAPEGAVVGFKKRKTPSSGTNRDRDRERDECNLNNSSSNNNNDSADSYPRSGLGSYSIKPSHMRNISQNESKNSEDETDAIVGSHSTTSVIPSDAQPSKIIMNFKKQPSSNKKYRTPDFDD